MHNSRIVHIGHITVQLCAETLDAKRVCAGILPQAVFDGSGVRSRVGRFPLVKATQRRQVRVVEEKVAATIDGCIIPSLFQHTQRRFDDGRVGRLAARFIERFIFHIVIDGIVELVPGNGLDDLLCRGCRRVGALIVTIEVNAHGHAVLFAALDIAQQLAVHVQTAFAVAGGIARAQDGEAGTCAATVAQLIAP